MAERLTEHNKTGWALKLNDPQNEFETRQQLMRKFKLACEKLGKLEDIMEKYGIDIQNLDYMLEDYSKNQGRDFAICEEMDGLKKDRDAWKRACELMGEELDMYATKEDNTISTAHYFYQQAKKEGEN